MSTPDAYATMRLRPASRLLIVAGTAAIVCAAAHIAISSTLSSLGERLFVGPYGGFGYIELGAVTACFVLIIALAVLRVGRTTAVCAVGFPIALVSLFVTVQALSKPVAVPIVSLPLSPFTFFLVVDTATVTAAFAVAAVLTDPRIPTWARIWPPLAFATATTLLSTLPYLR